MAKMNCVVFVWDGNLLSSRYEICSAKICPLGIECNWKKHKTTYCTRGSAKQGIMTSCLCSSAGAVSLQDVQDFSRGIISIGGEEFFHSLLQDMRKRSR